MSMEQNIEIARTLLEGIGSAREPDEIAAPFASDLVFEIQGHDGVMPWVGRKTGREAMADFIRGLRDLTEPLSFDVEDILASDYRSYRRIASDPDKGDGQDHRRAVRAGPDRGGWRGDAVPDAGGQLRSVPGGALTDRPATRHGVLSPGL